MACGRYVIIKHSSRIALHEVAGVVKHEAVVCPPHNFESEFKFAIAHGFLLEVESPTHNEISLDKLNCHVH